MLRPRFVSTLAFAAATSLLGCGASSPHAPRMTHRPDPSLPRCGGAPVCITTPECQYDEARRCESCTCAPVVQTQQQVLTAPFEHP